MRLKNIFTQSHALKCTVYGLFLMQRCTFTFYYTPILGVDRYCTMLQFSILIHNEWGLIQNLNIMKKVLRKVVKTFKQLADAKLFTFAQNVTTSMANAVAVFPTPVPMLADINTALGNYVELLQLAADRSKAQVVLKNQAKQALLVLLSQLADYVNLAGQGDEGVLVQSGFDLNKVPQPVSLKAPTRVVVLDGGNSGELVLKFKSVTGASSYLFQYTTDTLLADTSWVSIASTTTSYTFSGLTKGATYYCRAVAVGSNQQLMNSIVVNRVSQ